MFNFLFKSYSVIISILVIVSLLFCIFISTYNLNFSLNSLSYIAYDISKSSFPWPTPGYTTITSPFGRRISPTAGASTFHSGVDIAAPAGTNIISVCPGVVEFTGFSRCRWMYYNNNK